MRHHPAVGAKSSDEANIKQIAVACASEKRQVMGFPYEVSTTRIGDYITLIIPIGIPLTISDEAILLLKEQYDVVESTILVVPKAWLFTLPNLN